MNGRSDLWKVIIIGAVLAIAGGLVGGLLAFFAGAGYCTVPVEILGASRLPRLKIDSRTDLLPFEVEGHLTQTTGLMEAQQYTETVVFSVGNDGDVFISGTLTISDAIALAGDLRLANLDATGYVSATGNISSAIGIYGVGIDAGDGDGTNFGDIAIDTISADDGSSFSISNDWTNAGNTVADLGTVTTMDVNSATIGGVTVFTVANSIDIGPYDLRAATLTADGLTSGRVAMATTNGQLTDDADLIFATDTLTATKIGAFTLMGKLTAGATEIEGSNFDINGGDIGAATISGGLTWSAAQDLNNQNLTNADIDSGAIDGATIGGSLAAAGSFTTLVVTSTSDLQDDVSDSVGDLTFADDVVITGTLNMSNSAINNIGAAGTDFGDDGSLTLAEAITVTSGGANITGDIDGSAEFQVGTFLNLTAQTEISVTNGAVFTPTGSYQLIAAAAEVTPTISTTGFSVGDLLELHNTEAPVINFEAGGTQLLKDDYPMDQYDVLGLRWNGSAWVELYRTGPRI
jgi:hypothetical protein